MKYIIVIGSVISGIGKGITSSSIGILFKSMGYVVTMIKIDPYLNCDSGTIGPSQHGECFVLSDGGECDLDLGNYERFLDIELTRDHNITTGKIYQRVITKERNGDYLGATVQIVPHITDEIIAHISRVSHIPINEKIPDICIVEVGGTIGDIEGLPFIEALQQMKSITNDDFCFVCVSLAINNPEIKTKPIQHSISTIRSRGIFPDILVVRSKDKLDEEIKRKLHRMCQISPADIISNPNVPNIYHVPGVFHEQQICQRIITKLNLTEVHPINISIPYSEIVAYYEKLPDRLVKRPIVIGIVGKYIDSNNGSADTYLSLVRAIEHASMSLKIRIMIEWIDSENIDQHDLSQYMCFIIPGGFGSRGVKGKLLVANYARKNNIPILGICLGMQIMVVEYYNSFFGKTGSSREWINSTDNNLEYIIDILPDQTNIKGGTMRLGNYETKLISSKVKDLYGTDKIVERHRHRYEVNNKYVSDLEKAGLTFVGHSVSSNGANLMEIIELSQHTFYIGCQFHPEYKSRYENPHPLFLGLLKASIK